MSECQLFYVMHVDKHWTIETSLLELNILSGLSNDQVWVQVLGNLLQSILRNHVYKKHKQME